ncbi:MAG: hypothetical protein HY517_03235 [Candidatus Aenigmarchaeota archaeon]|nr:hypothetical protein [Candidatus Aenigmarchaeota archaeon]
MENKHLLAAVIAIAVAAFAVSVASAHNTNDNTGNGFGMGGMMNMMGMMGGFAHDQNDINWMREEMKEHMNFTDEEFDEMAQHCPMMRRR